MMMITKYSTKSTMQELQKFDYRSQQYDQKKIRSALESLRSRLQTSRVGQISYQIRVDPGTPLFRNNPQDKTMKEDVFTITLNRNTLYPLGWVDGQKYTILRNGQAFLLTAGIYSGTYHLSDVLGILVAEQLRFNTFDFTTYQHPHGTRESFEFFRKYMQSYKNWFKETGIDEGVKILLRHSKYL